MGPIDDAAGAALCNRLLDTHKARADYDFREFIRVLHQAHEYRGLYDILDSILDHDWEL